MLLIALLVLAGVFALLFLTRVGGARRAAIMRQWPAVLFAVAAFLALMRGAVWPGLAFAGLSFAAYVLSPALRRFFAPAPPQAAPEDPADREARSVLGVRRGASDSEIRSAYRSRMAQAHPDRGGSHNEAARLTAARDRLLGKKK